MNKSTFSKIILLTIFSFLILPNVSFASVDFFDTTYDSEITGANNMAQTYIITGNDCSEIPYYVLESITATVRKSGGIGTNYVDALVSAYDSVNGFTYHYANATTTFSTTAVQPPTTFTFSEAIDIKQFCEDNITNGGTFKIGLVSTLGSGIWKQDTDTENGYFTYQSGGYATSEFGGQFSGYLVDADTSTRTIWVLPENATSTPSRTIDYNFQYYLDTSTGYSTTTYPYINMDFISLAYPDDDVESYQFDVAYIDTLGFYSGTKTLNRDGYYLALLYFTDGVSRVLGSSSIKFNSATTTLTADIPIANPTSLCDSLDGTFDTAICKSMLFLFYPSDSALNKFNSLSDVFENKIPFAYYYLFKNKLEEFTLSSTTPPSLTFDFGSNGSTAISGEMTIFDMGDIDTNFDFSVAWAWIIRFMWIVFGVYIIARTLQVASVI